MVARKLRAVDPGETPTPPKVLSLAEAIEKGDRLQIELAQRRDIVSKLADASGPAAAALHRQLSLTNDKIEALEKLADQEGKAERAAVADEAFDAEAI